jgi:HEAT repeat protein
MSQLITDPKYGGAAEIMALDWPKLEAILRDPGASVFAKAKACQRLAVVGTHFTVPAIAPLLADPQLSHYARFALEPMPHPAADEALRNALGQVTGRLLVGVINSIGVRRDPEAIPQLGRLLSDPDPEVAQAAAAALARIRPPL